MNNNKYTWEPGWILLNGERILRCPDMGDKDVENLANEYQANNDAPPSPKSQLNMMALASIRIRRNNLLKDTDWAMISDSPFSAAEKKTIKTYRQELRDVTTDLVWAENVVWPTPPDILENKPIEVW